MLSLTETDDRVRLANSDSNLAMCACVVMQHSLQSAQRGYVLLPRGSESHTWKLRLHYENFVQANFNMADNAPCQQSQYEDFCVKN